MDFGEYISLKKIGSGGYATVYKVRHAKYGYIRAMRVLNAPIENEGDKTYQKFVEECNMLLRLGNGNHPNIVHIDPPQLRGGHASVVMDFVEGKTLIDYLKKQNRFIGIDEILNLLIEMSSALSFCHSDIYKYSINLDEDNIDVDPKDGSKLLITDETRRNLINKYRVIHNDIHSGNIMRREDGTYILLDFGLAIQGGKIERSSVLQNGVPEFKAPEKWNNSHNTLSTQSDIYSFGVVLYEMLTGQVPFPLESDSVEDQYKLYHAHIEQAPPSIYKLRRDAFEKAHPEDIYIKDYPDWLEHLILKCLAKNIEDRFQDGKELYEYAKRHNILSSNDRVSKLTEANKSLNSQIAAKDKEIEKLRSELNRIKQF